MGIRMLHRRTAPARTQAQAHADKVPFSARPRVPAHAAAASTARVPVDLAALLRRGKDTSLRVPAHLATTLRHATADLRHRLTGDDRDVVEQGRWPWAELGLSYLALVLTLLPRSRTLPTMTVFVAAADTLSERPGDPAPMPPPGCRAPEPDATL